MSRFKLRLFDAVAELTFDDGEMNLLSSAALTELSRALDALEAHTRLLVLRSGRERLFAAGADMAAMSNFDGDAALHFARLGQSLFVRIERLDCLSLAIVDGDCYGGALDLALACDLRWSTRRSRFAHPGSRIGIVTGFGGTERLPRKVSPELARRLLLANEVITAETAATLGLVDRLFDGAASVTDDLLRELEQGFSIEADVARTLLRCTPTLAPSESDLLARRTEQLLRGTPFNGRT